MGIVMKNEKKKKKSKKLNTTFEGACT